MKKSILVSAALTIGLTFTLVTAPQTVDATTKEISYNTCKELNKVYTNGVSKAKGTKNTVVNRTTKKAEYKNSNAIVSASLYKLNTKLDNDKDGIACEK